MSTTTITITIPITIPIPIPTCHMLKLFLSPLIAYLVRLRFPVLFGITAVLFVVDFLIPDVIPFVDEILLGLGAALLGSWKKKRGPDNAANDMPGS